jgi:hypothetical protein
MPGQAPRLATLGGHDVHVDVAIVLPAKRDPISIGRKNREAFVATGSKLSCFASLSRNAPQISAVSENDLSSAESRRVNQERTFISGNCEPCKANKNRGENKDSKTHSSSKQNQILIELIRAGTVDCLHCELLRSLV